MLSLRGQELWYWARCDASAATGRWLKKAGSATERECPRHMEVVEPDTSVLCCFDSLAMSLAAVFGLRGLSQLPREACVLSRSLNPLEEIVVPQGQSVRACTSV